MSFVCVVTHSGYFNHGYMRPKRQMLKFEFVASVYLLAMSATDCKLLFIYLFFQFEKGRLYSSLSSKMSKCNACKKKFKSTATKRDNEQHMKACAKRLSVLENDKMFGVIWKSLRINDFKCAHCPAAGISPVYKSNLREHVFRHVFKMHADKIPANAVKMNIKERAEKKAPIHRKHEDLNVREEPGYMSTGIADNNIGNTNIVDTQPAEREFLRGMLSLHVVYFI